MVGKGLDPIFAQGSAPGRSAIAVVRLSGKLPASLYDELKIYEDERSFFLREINFGDFADSGLVLNFPAPGSYTGETRDPNHLKEPKDSTTGGNRNTSQQYCTVLLLAIVSLLVLHAF